MCPERNDKYKWCSLREMRTDHDLQSYSAQLLLGRRDPQLSLLALGAVGDCGTRNVALPSPRHDFSLNDCLWRWSWCCGVSPCASVGALGSRLQVRQGLVKDDETPQRSQGPYDSPREHTGAIHPWCSGCSEHRAGLGGLGELCSKSVKVGTKCLKNSPPKSLQKHGFVCSVGV